ncbi:hypothetical protein HRR83_001058 [Exophiala dermatitidis]|uniref:Uncharacterized protein n=2 Tax=Exophiala dermatitidis TaxID=5970 RepID=H6C7H1_EXODN|nr:uncharacterized protein HMPREF1120_07652 [Exophiala dermatitidis NIH/UT8656]KAJ4525869.1 hypothetical protein HRR74_001062 [Exophiala dermatitidis]EHY59667.1 hypothetical protein HMPREF1120_07652 [Exophiala dermatitidis NIH/UT8656]KAJ4527185.1 hypothetical protein HRR73_001982 [Exophiala dermatitidis]KAJ4532908.1 hypothetical protein HRR76_007883 [Exophiala dermatitidis]KAJ4538823.1 hypothetical protein HRR77_006749 [Exophiala dermatitidis]
MDSQPRPTVYRSRSSTDPSRPKDLPTISEPAKAEGNLSPTPTRPNHLRSKSYLSPTETKTRNAITLPAASALEKTAEKLPRIHLPGSSHRRHQHRHHHSHSHSQLPHDHRHEEGKGLPKGHRPTQSDAQPATSTTSRRQQQSKETPSNLPHLVAGLNAEREKRLQQPPQPPNVAAPRSGQQQQQQAQQYSFGPSGTTSSDYNEGGRFDPGQQQRVTSDSNRAAALRPKTSFEIALERAEEARVARRLYVKKEEIMRRDVELAEAEEEMRSRIAAITAKGAEITRRLDYGYYNLLETVGSLVAIITGFQSLSKQSEQLIVNFDKETRRLDADTNKRVNSFKAAFEARDRKTQALAERGQKANAKAEELSLRLENARLVIQNWEKREDQVRKVWGRVVGVVWWTSITVVALVVLVVLGKEGWFRGDPVKAGLGAHSEGSWNASLQLDGSEGSVGARNERLLLMQDDDQHHSSYVHKGKEPVSVSNSASVESAPASPESVPKVPEDVRRLLLDIAEKNRRRKVKFPGIIRDAPVVHGGRRPDMGQQNSPNRNGAEDTTQLQQRHGQHDPTAAQGPGEHHAKPTTGLPLPFSTPLQLPFSLPHPFAFPKAAVRNQRGELEEKGEDPRLKLLDLL